jgi:hypothetical protein
LNVFLNEECKDAINLNEFVQSIRPSLTDLENTGRLGYISGISELIINNLNDLEETRRPIHCSDLRRETIYIKDNNIWEREEAEKPLLTHAIKQIANENIKQINEWHKVHPDCSNPMSKDNSTYLNIICNSMSGYGETDSAKNIKKIISNITKEILIQK